MKEIIELLQELIGNCGDNRGRDGEYLSDQASVILEKLESHNSIE